NLGIQAGTVYSVAFSPDGKRLASAGHSEPAAPAAAVAKPAAPAPGTKPGEPPASGTAIKLWDTTSWKESKTLKAHDGPVTGVLFTADSANLLSIGMMDRTVRLWSMSEPGAKPSEPAAKPSEPGAKVSQPGASATGAGKERKKMVPTADDLYGIT